MEKAESNRTVNIKFRKSHGIAALAFVLVAAGAFVLSQGATDNGGTLPNTPVHWHPTLAIYINGEKQTIPANIGIGPQYANHPLYEPQMRMTGVHTHATDGVLHWEITRTPTREDLKLGAFFSVWDKTFDSECVLDYCNGERTVKMFVNGERNYEYGNYLIRDGDEVVIRYE